jgi:putative Mg2+ transporter-C (MgtC) family protein
VLDWWEIVLRLGAAALAGGALGLNRDLHGKPIGVRTLGLVGLAAAVIVVLAVSSANPARISDATSRVIQGILTGIGFLGAGVIVHREKLSRVHGLTSAACTWLTACLGIACGAGYWRVVIVALAITFMLLLAGGTLEWRLHRALGGRPDSRERASAPASPADAPPS